MRLYHQPRSRSTRVLWLLEELGAPFDLTVIAREDKQAADWPHPLGRVPVLVDDDGPLFESAALVLHLADLHADSGLIAPPGSRARGEQYQWCLFAMTEVEAPLMDIARQRWKDDGEPYTDIVEPARQRFTKAVRVLETVLGTGDYLVDNAFSVADIVTGAILSFARTAELAELPAEIVPYVDRLEARPARQRAAAVT